VEVNTNIRMAIEEKRRRKNIRITLQLFVQIYCKLFLWKNNLFAAVLFNFFGEVTHEMKILLFIWESLS
jgi:hypothetical protein